MKQVQQTEFIVYLCNNKCREAKKGIRRNYHGPKGSLVAYSLMTMWTKHIDGINGYTKYFIKEN